jgi:hypothetical protein
LWGKLSLSMVAQRFICVVLALVCFFCCSLIF